MAERSIAGALTARRIWLDAAHSVPDAELAWDDGGRIVAVRRARGRVRDLVILPGLVDAHAHLQLEPLGADAPKAFVPWIGAVIAQRSARAAPAWRAAARCNARALLQDGVTAVGEIDSTGASPPVLRALGLGGRCYQELVGFHLAGRAASRHVRLRWQPGAGELAAGLSPHAPYSVSADLFRAAARRSRHLAIHCAELPEEQEFLHTGRGPFAALLASMGRLPAGFRPPRTGAVRWLQRLGVLRAGTHLVHCQELERGDAARIAAAGAGIVVCPGTIAWFGRTPPPVGAWLAAGIPVAIGTDSRASNDAWSLRAELRRLAALCPDLAEEQLLAIATSHGARVLGLRGRGRLARGRRADFVAFPAGGGEPRTQLAGALLGDTGPRAVFVGGRRVR